MCDPSVGLVRAESITNDRHDAADAENMSELRNNPKLRPIVGQDTALLALPAAGNSTFVIISPCLVHEFFVVVVVILFVCLFVCLLLSLLSSSSSFKSYLSRAVNQVFAGYLI